MTATGRLAVLLGITAHATLSGCGLAERSHFLYFVPAASMEPTIAIHDILFANPRAYTVLPPREGDVVIFWPPIDGSNPFVKRVIGLPGDRIRIHNGIVYRNGNALAERYTGGHTASYELEIDNYDITVDGRPLDPLLANIPPHDQWTAPDRIPTGCYLLLGDNRNDSEDSHVFGFAQAAGSFASGVARGQRAGFVARVEAIVYPISHAHDL